MIGVAVAGADAVARRLREAESNLGRATERFVRSASLLARRKLVERMSWPGSRHPFWGKVASPLPYLTARSGQTRARLSPGGLLFRSGDRVSSAVGSPDPHVALAERGGTIQGKRYLRIPTAAMQTAAGVDRLSGTSARTLASAFIFRSKAGNLWIAARDRAKRLSLLYLLVESVRIRRRPIFALVTDEVNAATAADARAQVAAVVAKANG